MSYSLQIQIPQALTQSIEDVKNVLGGDAFEAEEVSLGEGHAVSQIVIMS